MADPTELRVTVVNDSPEGGTFLTPVYFGFHNGDFDLFDTGAAASPGLESLAEDGSPAILATERLAASPGSQGLVVTGEAGPVATEETTSANIAVDGETNTEVSFAAMILPSNDAFIGTNEAAVLFDGDGNFLGEQTFVFDGTRVYDAGTEVNTELDAAFINQLAPNTGVDENGVVLLHPGFNGSVGNPVGDGDQIILGGTNDFGEFIDPVIADFTIPGAEIATIHINTVVVTDGTDENDNIQGGDDDDIVDGGDGNDFIRGGEGWDVIEGGDDNDWIGGGRGQDLLSGGRGNDAINGGRGDDHIEGGNGNDDLEGSRGQDYINGGNGNDFVTGGIGNDELHGGDANDFLGGNRGADEIYAGDGNDEVNGGRGNDWISGGLGDDQLRGSRGSDTFAFKTGDGNDEIVDLSQNDLIELDVNGFNDFADITAAASAFQGGTLIDFGDGNGSLFLNQVAVDELDASQFAFV